MRAQAAATFRERFTVEAHAQRLIDVLEADAARPPYPLPHSTGLSSSP